MPILQERDYVVYDPEVIILYVDERYPSPALLPIYPVDRARTRLAMKRIDKEWYSILAFIKDNLNTEKGNQAKKALLDSFKAIEPIFSENEFFMSEAMTLADCALAALLYALPQIEVDIKGLKEIEKYAARLFERESFQQTLPKKKNANRKLV